MHNVDNVMITFKLFLEKNFDIINGLFDSNSELINDWLQANWELMVEAILFPKSDKYLEVYGEGADCNPNSSRVWKPEILPTHAIFCVPKFGNSLFDLITKSSINQKLAFGNFVNWNGDDYQEKTPFNAILIEDFETQIILNIE